MNEYKIKDLSVGNKVAFFLMVDTVSLRTRKGGDNKYLTFSFKDSSGKIGGNYWSVQFREEKLFSANDIVFVEGEVSEFNGQKQLTVNKIRKAEESDNVDKSEFVKTSPRSGEDMYADIMKYVEKVVENEDLKKLTTAIYEDYKERLIKAPAAISFHHAEIGGLLRHSLEMVRSCYVICQVYPFLSKELLVCAAALHDIGKIEENVVNELGLFKEHTVDGELTTHIYRGAMIIEEYAKKLEIDPEIRTLLVHMILAHHGVPEFGSPIPPKFPEAFVLHIVDDMDAKLYEMEDMLGRTEAGKVSEKCKACDDNKLYRSPLMKVAEDFDTVSQ